MRILEVHARVNTLQEIEEVLPYFDAVYVMGIYEPVEYSAYHNAKYGLDPSLFAIYDHYTISPSVESLILGLRRLKVKLLFDFIPNHRGIQKNFTLGLVEGIMGKGQWYPGNRSSYKYGTHNNTDFWADTFQINYADYGVLKTMSDELGYLLRECDGVRCDMAELLLRHKFNQNHGTSMPYEPWDTMLVHKSGQGKIAIAEAYCHLHEIKEAGFDFVYRVEPRRNQLIHRLDHKDLIVVDNHDEDLLYWTVNRDLYKLEAKLEELSSFRNTLYYLPAIQGSTIKPSANYWRNDRKWKPDYEVNALYLSCLKNL